MGPLTPGPSSESLQGRNPREIGADAARSMGISVLADADDGGDSDVGDRAPCRSGDAGCASYSLPVSIIDNIERRNASARPILGLAFSSAIALVMSLTVESDATSQCDTNNERAPA
jgi:hypothetical protein